MAKHNTGWAIVGTIPILGFILVLLAHRKDSYAHFYAKQGLVLGLTCVVLQAILGVLIVTAFLIPLVGVATLILWIISIVHASSGSMKQTPITGDIAKRLKF